MSETHAPNSPPVNPPSDLPPLRVHHLMIWMAATAVLISTCMWFHRTARNGPPIQSSVVVGALILVAVSVSGAVCCTAWGLYWRLKGGSFPSQPGQWLLIEIAAVISVIVLWLALIFAIHRIEEAMLIGLHIVLITAIACGLIGSNIYIAEHKCDMIAWRVVFYSLAALPVAMFFFALFQLPLVHVPLMLTAIALLWAAWCDWRSPLPRHWTHLFGLIAGIILCAATFAPAI